jgi:hypothetical protein
MWPDNGTDGIWLLLPAKVARIIDDNLRSMLERGA